MTPRCKWLSLGMLTILALSLCLMSAQAAVAQTDQTSSKLHAANTAVEQAFNVVLDAEKAGANVTNLLTQLNNAFAV